MAARAGRSQGELRAFVRRHTRLAPVEGVRGVRLHVADDVALLSGQLERELGPAERDLPYWAFPWAGGLAVARYVAEHPDLVAGRQVLDVASGSGLCAIVAARCGAASVMAADVDPLAGAAIVLNARANGVRVGLTRGDPLAAPPPDVDVILAGDVCYQETMAARMVAWLRRAAAAGSRVLLGDPGRTYLPPGLEVLAAYEVRTSRELEPADAMPATVYAVGP